MPFSDIPIRENGDKFTASWVNTIRQYLVDVFDSENLGQIQCSIVNDQSTLANLTDMLLDSTSYISAVLRYDIMRRNETTERREVGYITCIWNETDEIWTLFRRLDGGEDALNNGADSIHIASDTGQLEYKTDDMGGVSHEGYIRFKFVSKFVG